MPRGAPATCEACRLPSIAVRAHSRENHPPSNYLGLGALPGQRSCRWCRLIGCSLFRVHPPATPRHTLCLFPGAFLTSEAVERPSNCLQKPWLGQGRARIQPWYSCVPVEARSQPSRNLAAAGPQPGRWKSGLPCATVRRDDGVTNHVRADTSQLVYCANRHYLCRRTVVVDQHVKQGPFDSLSCTTPVKLEAKVSRGVRRWDRPRRFPSAIALMKRTRC